MLIRESIFLCLLGTTFAACGTPYIAQGFVTADCVDEDNGLGFQFIYTPAAAVEAAAADFNSFATTLDSWGDKHSSTNKTVALYPSKPPSWDFYKLYISARGPGTGSRAPSGLTSRYFGKKVIPDVEQGLIPPVIEGEGDICATTVCRRKAPRVEADITETNTSDDSDPETTENVDKKVTGKTGKYESEKKSSNDVKSDIDANDKEWDKSNKISTVSSIIGILLASATLGLKIDDKVQSTKPNAIVAPPLAPPPAPQPPITAPAPPPVHLCVFTVPNVVVCANGQEEIFTDLRILEQVQAQCDTACVPKGYACRFEFTTTNSACTKKAKHCPPKHSSLCMGDRVEECDEGPKRPKGTCGRKKPTHFSDVKDSTEEAISDSEEPDATPDPA